MSISTNRVRARRRRKERKKKAVVMEGYDRHSTDEPQNVMLRAVSVDDPYERGAKIVAIANIRDDPLGRMHARDQIDDAQYAAGREYQRLWEHAEIVGVKAMDTTKEPVDGGAVTPDPFTDKQRAAMRTLDRLGRELGQEGEALCRLVLVERKYLGVIAESYGVRISDRSTRYFGMRFRECLETLAVALNFAPRRQRVS